MHALNAGDRKAICIVIGLACSAAGSGQNRTSLLQGQDNEVSATRGVRAPRRARRRHRVPWCIECATRWRPEAQSILKANPPVGFSPLRVRLVVDVRNGANDHQDFYCPGVQWDWGDGTVSENSEDRDHANRVRARSAPLLGRARIPAGRHLPGVLPPQAEGSRDRRHQRERRGSDRRPRRPWGMRFPSTE